MASQGQPFFQPPPATQLPALAKPQGPFNPNALSQAKVHAVIEVRTHTQLSADAAHALVLQRVKMLKNAGFTEENNSELAKMVAFLKAMAHQRE